MNTMYEEDMYCAWLTAFHVSVEQPPSAQLKLFSTLFLNGERPAVSIIFTKVVFFPVGYRKGAEAERELMRMLWGMGAAVVRSAGSGNSYAPDVVAIAGGRTVAFECKAWNKDVLFVRREQYEKMAEWSARAGTLIYLAWKYPRVGWFFVPLEYLEEKEKHYSIRLEDVRRLTTTLDVILGRQDVLF